MSGSVGAKSRGEAAIAHLRSLLTERGEIDVVDGELTVGGVPIYGDTDLVDAVKHEHGFGCTVFHGNVRVATTALNPGATTRALGTSANEQITQRVFRRGEPFAGVTRTLQSEWVIAYEPLRDRRGKIVGMLAAYRAIEDFLHDLALLDDSPEGVMLRDRHGRVLDANRAANDMLGVSRSELLQRTLRDFTVESSASLADEAPAELTDEPVCLERTWRRSDGFAFAVEVSVGWIEHRGEPCLLTIARDFTEQRRAREELRVLNEELAESLRQLKEMQTRLVMSERLATLGNLVAGIAHEVNTPLGAIASSAETARLALGKLSSTDPSNERWLLAVTRALGIVDSAAERIDDVLRMMRSFVRLDEAAWQEVDLNAELDKTLTMANHRMRSGGRIVKSYGELPRFLCDPRLLNQAFLALILNALQAVDGLPDRSVEVTTSAKGGEISVEVSDDGVGIAREELASLFDIAYTTRPLAPGLGLTIAKRVVEDHDGTIEAHSAGPGRGATFRIRLPVTARSRPVAPAVTAG